MINEECSADGRSGDDGKVPHLPLSRKPRPFLCGKLLIGRRGRSSWMEPLCPTVVSAFTSRRRRPLGHLPLDSAHGCKHGGEVQPRPHQQVLGLHPVLPTGSEPLLAWRKVLENIRADRTATLLLLTPLFDWRVACCIPVLCKVRGRG